MSEKFIVKMLGTDAQGTERFGPMTREEASAKIEELYDDVMSAHDGGNDFDETTLEEEYFQISGYEFYQTAYMEAENTEIGLEYYLAEIRSLTVEADEYATCYEYECMNMGVYDITEKIRKMAKEAAHLIALNRGQRTKEWLRAQLKAHIILDYALTFIGGQECLIYKAPYFYPGSEIIYIPDVALNDIPMDRVLTDEEIDGVLSKCYTGDDFIEIAGNDRTAAERLFNYVNWQHPSSAWDAGEVSDEVEED